MFSEVTAAQKKPTANDGEERPWLRSTARVARVIEKPKKPWRTIRRFDRSAKTVLIERASPPPPGAEARRAGRRLTSRPDDSWTCHDRHLHP